MKLTAAALFAFGLATAATGALAQTTPTTTTNRATVDDPAVNQRESRNYDALVGSDSSFRSRRMQTECGSIESADLKQQCMQSFAAPATTSSGSRSPPLSPALSRCSLASPTMYLPPITATVDR